MKILIIDDHLLFREGLAMLLGRLEERPEILEAESGQKALEVLLTAEDLDIVLLDFNLPDTDGLSLLREIKTTHPFLPVAMLSAESDASLIQKALQSGATGFITKNSSSDVMISAIRLILSGSIYIPPEILGGAPNNQRAPSAPVLHIETTSSGIQPPRRASHSYNITGRQLEVLREMAGGLSNKEIARVLDMSPSTVKVHVAAILREFDAKNRMQAVTIARDIGLIDSETPAG